MSAEDHQHRPGGTRSDVASWEERYSAAPALWSGQVNPSLVEQVSGLHPGRALDVGCGEGGDVLWLAGRGWQVSGLDWSAVALARAAEHAAAAGLTDRVQWIQGDIDTWLPPAGAYDLVTAHFLHPTAAQRLPLLDRLATSVAPDGTLLWVGHPYAAEPAALWGADRFVAADQLAADLDPQLWDVQVAGQRPRTGGAEGHHHADEILQARRR